MLIATPLNELIPLNAAFFQADTVTVAKNLIGHLLWRQWPQSNTWVLCRIVETEAYTQDDPACHAYQRQTGRAANLYQEPGLAYVYLIYGMYYCLNVVTEPAGTAGAVLFRGLEVVAHAPDWLPLPLNGPGKLCKALNITKAADNGIDMLAPDSPLCLMTGETLPLPVVTTRIGITQGTDRLWRFYDPASIGVSKRV